MQGGAERKVLVVGAGPGGIGTAAVLSRRGFDVTLASRTATRLQPLIDAGGVTIEGEFGDGFVPLPSITTDVAAAAAEADLVLIAVPGYGQVPVAETIAPHLRDDVVVLLLTGSAGSLEIAPILTRNGLDLDRALLGETVTLPLSGRMLAPASVRLRLDTTMRTAAFPGRNTARLIAALDGVFRTIPTPHVLDPGLNNPNFLIHPAPMVLNYAAVERADGYFSIMNEGMTPATLRLLDAVDAEKMALQEALGLERVTIDEQYTGAGSGPWVYRSKGEPFGLRDRIWDRYVTEDVPYGTVMYSSLGRLLGVPTPVSDACNTVLSCVEQRDFWSEGRTVERLGLAGMTREQLLDHLVNGPAAAARA